MEDIVEIIISNNCSPDKTSSKVDEFEQSHPRLRITLINQPNNIGLEGNALAVLDKSEAEYVMYLGDDDYLDASYLVQVVGKLSADKELECVIPSYRNIDLDGRLTNSCRDVDIPSRFFPGGFANCIENSFRGHQLSGLTLKRAGLLDTYRKNDVSNLYPFIFFASRRCLDGKTWHFTDYPVMVTAAPQQNKDWGYGNDGLISHVFDNYRKLEEIDVFQRARLEWKFLKTQNWRYGMYLLKNKSAYVNAIWHIVKGSNTSWPTKILFPICIGYQMMRKLIRKCLR